MGRPRIVPPVGAARCDRRYRAARPLREAAFALSRVVCRHPGSFAGSLPTPGRRHDPCWTSATMPTATTTSTQRTESDDAPRAARSTEQEAAVRPPMTSQPEPCEAAEIDPYDNIACTD